MKTVENINQLTGKIHETWELSEELYKSAADLYAKCPDTELAILFRSLCECIHGIGGILLAIQRYSDRD